MKHYVLAFFIALAIILSGCTQQQQTCAQVITPAISPNGICSEFPTPCDVPKGYTLAESCNANAENEPGIPAIDLCENSVCANKCEGATSYESGTCNEGNCEYEKVTEKSEKCGYTEPAELRKYDFESTLVFCEFDSLLKNYTMFYQIRNYTNNNPTYKSKIWLKVPSLDYAQAKTIQGEYTKGKVLWEDVKYDYVDKTYTGQQWQIRNQDTPMSLDYQLIFCEPEFSEKEQCTPNTGVVLVEGNTEELCRVAGQ
ncbi:MAG: hypothetical protein COV47_02220, partial [Candidatus Diapherotrites archaeon CG11_big_fil_rev_8_21_14_0_20_37_9]